MSGSFEIKTVILADSYGHIDDISIVEIGEFELKLVGPNPFNPSTAVNVVVPYSGYVSVKIYNIKGQLVSTLADGFMESNQSGYTLQWNASGMSSGVYLVRAETSGFVSTQKLMLIK